MRLITRRIAGAVGVGVILALPALPVHGQTRPGRPEHPRVRTAGPNGPKSIGKFEDWQAATHSEGGQTVCYAFTRVQSSAPAVPGRGDVVLTVTQRPTGRDAVAISAGFAYPAGAEVVMAADKAELPFYTSGRSAFARDGHAATMAFDKARTAVAKSPAPKGITVSDTFSLRGFTPAYAAINKACASK